MALTVLNYWAMKTTSIHKHLKTFCIPVEYTGQSNTWNNREIFMHLFFHFLLPSITEHSCKTGIPEDSKCILLLDNCNAHSNEFTLHSEDTCSLPSSKYDTYYTVEYQYNEILGTSEINLL
jgi:hypothetical protein